VRAEVARADRHFAVRTAADGWRRAGAIDEAAFRAVVAAYPEDRVRLSPGFRILAGLAALVGGGAMAALAASLLAPAGRGTLLAYGLTLVFAAATEIQIGRLRRAQAGAEYATAILSLVCAAWAWESSFDSDSMVLVAAGLAVISALDAWRWGFALFAAQAAVFALVTCSQGPFGRLAWSLLGVGAFPLILRMARSPRWTPAHRRCAIGAGLVLLAGTYVAVNLYSLDHRWIEGLELRDRSAAGVWARRAAIAGTILMPAMVLYLGVRFRDRALLIAGALFTAASLITLRHYHPVGPWWFSLAFGGSACLAIAVALRRWLAAGPARERLGFTADPLFEDRRMVQLAQAAATIAAMSPGARVSAEGPFQGSGGRSGGGGAAGGA
jgi:hypothetical protein